MYEEKNNFLRLLPLLMVILIDVMGVVLVLPVLTPLILKIDSGMVSAATSLFTRDFLYGLVLAIFPLFMFLSTPILGDLSDKFGRKKILLLCMLASAISYFISAIGIIYHSLLTLIVSRALAGLAAGTQPIASAAVIDMSSAATKTKHLGWVVLINSVGVILGPLLGGLTTEKKLVSWFGYDTPFLLASLLALLNGIYLWFCFKEKNWVKSSHAIQLTKGFRLFISAFAESKFSLLSLAYFCFILAWSLYFQAINWYFMQVYYYDASKLGLFLGYIGVVFFIATGVITRIMLRIFSNEIIVFLIFMGLMTLANIGSALSHAEYAQWLWAILNAMSNVICYTIILSLFSSLVGEESQGWIMGVSGAIGAITWGIGSIIAGPLGYLNIQAPFWTAGMLCIASFIFMLIYARYTSRCKF
jgi:DHA1 family tetracycline resistance protein-like MFS transporter